jgi:multiple sugar transport system ATP-binding protein
VVGSQVTLGIRPEHVQVGSGSLSGEVGHIEQMGEHTYLYLDTELSPQPLIAKTPPGHVRIGHRLAFDLRADMLHLFHPDGRAAQRIVLQPAAVSMAL